MTGDPDHQWQALATVLADPSRCPSCAGRLQGPRCRQCGADLAGPTGMALWTLQRQLSAGLGERTRLVGQLRIEAGAARAAAAQAAYAVQAAHMAQTAQAAHTTAAAQAAQAAYPAPGVTVPPAPTPTRPAVPVWSAAPRPVPGVPPGRPPVRPAAPSAFSRLGVQGLLVSLGALLLAVAGIVFLVVAWDRLSLSGRAVIVAGLTAAALAVAAWLRPRLPQTAEAIGGLAVAFVMADSWAIRANGLWGADRLDALGYIALAAGVAGALLLTWGWLGRVRAGSVSATALMPLAALVAGLWLGSTNTALLVAGPALGAAAASALGALRAVLPTHWAPERALARVAAVGGWIGGLALGLVDALDVSLRPLGLVAVAALAVVHAATDRHTRSWWIGWSVAAGAAAPLAALVCAGTALRWSGADLALLAVVVPVAAGGLTVAIWRVCRPRLRPLPVEGAWATRAARTITAGAMLPGGLVLAIDAAAVAASSSSVWTARLWDDIAVNPEAARPVIAANVGVLAGAGLLAVTRPTRWSVGVASGIAMAALGLGVVPGTPRLVSAAALLVVAVAAMTLIARPPRLAPGPYRAGLLRATCWTVATGAEIGALLVSLGVRELTLPVLASVTVLLLVQVRLTSNDEIKQLLSALAVVGGVGLAVTIAALRSDALNARVAAGTAAAALLVAVLARRGRSERAMVAWVVAAALLALGATGSIALVAPEVGYPWPAAIALVVGLAALGVSASRRLPSAAGRAAAGRAAVGTPSDPAAAANPGVSAPEPKSPPVPADWRWLCIGSAAVLPLAVTATVALLTSWAQAPSVALAPTVLGAAVVSLCGLLLAVWGIRMPTEPRRVGVELGAAAAALCVVLLELGSDAHPLARPTAWIVLLLLGVAATAAAVPADRHRLGWLGWGLLSASSADRLAAAQVDLVEAYTVAPALALLAVTAYRLRSDPRARARDTLLPGLGLLATPSVLAAATGTPWRPALGLALAAVAVLTSPRWGRRVEPALLLVGCATATGIGLIRAIPGAMRHTPELAQVEPWAIGAAAVLATGLWQLRRRGHALPATLPPGAAEAGVLALVVVPSLLAALSPTDDPARRTIRAAAVLAVGLSLAVAQWWWPRERRAAPASPWLAVPVRYAALGAGLLAAAIGWSLHTLPVETWTLSAAVALGAIGWHRLVHDPTLRSWEALGPALGVGLMPSTLAGWIDGPLWRVLLVAGLAGATLVVGAIRRLQAPVVVGAAVLAAHALVQLGPTVVAQLAALPRWVVLGALGALLLGLGATYETRLRELRVARMRVATLR